MALYKFIEKEFFDSFFAGGSLRIGTIYNFKDTVEHGLSRGDQSEGEHHLIRGIDGTVAISKDKHEPIISEVFEMAGEGQAHISNLSTIVPRRCEDGFVFCTSYIYNEDLFWRWHKKNNVDSCYEITNPKAFFGAISRAIENSANFFANSNVTYTDKNIDYQSAYANSHPAFTKVRVDYGWQYENRSVWGARGPCGPLKPSTINVPEAIQFCKPLAFLENGGVSYVRA